MAVLAIGLLIKYTTKSAPSGPDSQSWALGIFYVIALLVLIALSFLLFYFKWHKVALVIILSPLIVMVLSVIISGSVDIYVYFPSLSKVTPLNIIVNNDSPKAVHLKMDIMFPLAFSNDETLYKTLDYYAPANTKKEFTLSSVESRMLCKKASSVGVYIYKRDTLKASDGTIVERDLDNYIYKSEQPNAFANGQYIVDVKEMFEKKGR
jgi:hypothetical protein